MRWWQCRINKYATEARGALNALKFPIKVKAGFLGSVKLKAVSLKDRLIMRISALPLECITLIWLTVFPNDKSHLLKVLRLKSIGQLQLLAAMSLYYDPFQVFSVGTKDGKPANALVQKHTYVLQPSGYRDVLKLADNFSAFNERLKYAHLRPLVPVKSDPRSWWKYACRVVSDQIKKASLHYFLNSSLTEEAAAEVLGLTTAHAIWTALETAYSNSSVERIHSLRDSLRNLSKGTSTVSDYGRQFKGICDKLAAIGQPVDEMDKLHWFVCGLGASFETFSTAIRTTKPFTTFRDLLSQAESHEMFLKSLHGSATPPAAFFSQQSGSRSLQGRQQRQQNYSRGGGHVSNSNGGRGRRGRRPPHCQLYASCKMQQDDSMVS
ncbi:putative RNA-directed DNA polymerase [Tanacetum coccineum]